MNPFVPSSRANVAIISSDAPTAVIIKLKELIPIVVQTVPLPNAAVAVNRHPDMAMFPVDENTIVTAPSVYKYYSSILEPLGLTVIKGKSEPGESYPQDILYNAAILGGKAIHLKEFTDSTVLDELNKKGTGILNIKQGYAKCSLAILDERSAITSDSKIADTLRSIGCDVLLIEPGHIQLPGMKCGFIGGAVGLLSPNELLLTGSIRLHPSQVDIEAFIKSRGIEIIELCSDRVVDLGTILTFSVFQK